MASHKEYKKGGGKDNKSDPPPKLKLVRDDKTSNKEDSITERDPLSGIDDLDIDKDRRDTKIPPKKGE